MNSKSSMKFQSALIGTGLVQPVSDSTRGGFLETLCRQIPGQEKGWLSVVNRMLELQESSGGLLGDLHVCRRYIRKNGSMVFGWHISIDCKSAKALSAAVDAIVNEILLGCRPSLDEPQQRHEYQEPAIAPQAAVAAQSRAPLAPGQHPPPRAASPRAPGAPGGPNTPPPNNLTPGLRVVQNFRDENGRQTIVEEMPLPHVHSEMNRPNSKGKGAKFTGGG